MLKKAVVATVLLLALATYVCAVTWVEEISPPTTRSNYCSGGTCQGSLFIPGNLTVAENASIEGDLEIGGFVESRTPLGGFDSDEDITGEVSVVLTGANTEHNLTNLNLSGIAVGSPEYFSLSESEGTFQFTNRAVGIWRVYLSGSFQASETGVYHCWVVLNGVNQEVSWEQNIGTANNVGSASDLSYVNVTAANDVMYVSCETTVATNPTLTFNHFSFNAEKVSVP